MTEEDQLLVAKAALAGVRFWPYQRGGRGHTFWKSSVSSYARTTLGRAAAAALMERELAPPEEIEAYLDRTGGPISSRSGARNFLPDAAKRNAARRFPGD